MFCAYVRQSTRLTTIRGLEAIRKSSRVYLEAYTSMLLVPTERLVRHTALPTCLPHPRRRPFTSDPCTLPTGRWLNRCDCCIQRVHSNACSCQQEADTILAGADTADVSFLVVGDPFGYALLTNN